MASTPITQPISLCVQDLRDRIQTVPDLKDKHLFVFNEDDLMDKIKGATFPAVGIVYEGMRARPEQGSAQVGVSAELVFSICIINRPDVLFNADTKTSTLNILDQLRGKMLATRSVTGHFWKFVVEAATAEKKGIVFWVQRWSTPIQLHRPI